MLFHLVYLKPGQVEYLGNKNLLQFTVTNFSISGSKNDSVVEVEFTLKRMYMFHLVNIYLPTICVMIIVEVTLFLDESHFESNIMVALTGMLVMYTLYQSISLTLPPTAYLKLLDYWLIFSLIMLFLIFMIEVCWEMQTFQQRPKVVRENSWMTEGLKTLLKENPPNRKAPKIIVVGATVTFTFCYVFYTFCVYNG